MTGADPDDRPVRPRWASNRLGWIVLVALAYVPPLLTARGKVVADTKQYLYLDPARLLGRAPTMWDPNIGLGTVTHQTIGYLFPMGPYYRILQAVGVPDWVAQRLWLGTIVLAAGAGMLYLGRTFGMRGPGIVVGALLYMFSPYALDYAARISVILLPWAALPWLLALTDKALRDRVGERSGWRYPAIFAVVVQVVGGVNATALVFVGVAPVLWIVWSVAVTRDVAVRRALAVTAKIGGLTLAASLWWIAGLSIQSGYGLDILKYTETVKAVSRTSTPNEVLRGLGYWFFYGQDKLGPWIDSAARYTQSPGRILVGYGLAAAALLSAALIRWRHRLFFLVLLLVGVVVAVGAFPYDDPSPYGSLWKQFGEHSKWGLALRSTGRITPVVMLSLAVFVAVAVDAATRRLRASGFGAASLLPAVLVVAAVAANFPALWDGSWYGKNLERPSEIPGYWKDAIAALDAGSHETRIVEMPGADFASYRWGNTVDPITPGLTDRPYVARELIPWGGPGTADLLNAFDRRFQEHVSDPRGVAPILRLLAAGDVVMRYDIQDARYDLVRPRFLSRALAGAAGLGEPQRFGGTLAATSSRFPRLDELLLASPPDERPTAPVEVRSVDDAQPIVRALAADHPLLVSGSGEGLIDAADVGLLDDGRVVLYSASFAGDDRALRAQLDEHPVVVVTDSNRRRARRWSTVLDNTGYTEQRGEEPYAPIQGDARLDVFPHESDDAGTQTVTEQIGTPVAVRSVQASAYGNPISFTPEDRAAMAFDGDPDTAWKVAAFDRAVGESIRLRLARPVEAGAVNLVQVLKGPRDRYITEVELRFDGGRPVRARLGPESRTARGQTIEFPSRRFSQLTIQVEDTNKGRGELLFSGDSAVGFGEIRVVPHGRIRPITVREVVVMPTDAVDAVRAARDSGGDSVRLGFVYLMSRERQTDTPPRRSPEAAIVRRFRVPDAREFSLTGTARIQALAPPARIDRALGAPTGGVVTEATESLAGCVHCRPWSAIDGDPATSYQTPFVGTRQRIAYELPAPVEVRHLDLQVVADGRHSLPTRLRLSVGGREQDVVVPPVRDVPERGENATVTVPIDVEPMRGRSVGVEILGVRPVRTTDYHSGLPIDMPVGIAELGIAGLRAPRLPAQLPGVCRTDLLRVDGQPAGVRIAGSRHDAEWGGAASVELCDPATGGRATLHLAAGDHVVEAARGLDTAIDLDRLVLASDERGRPSPVADGRIVRAGPHPSPAPRVRVTGETRTGYDLRVSGAQRPFWLVLSQSRSDGWQARAGGTHLAAPTLVNGYANGWRIDPTDGHGSAGSAGTGDIEVALDWTPQRRVWFGLAASSVAVLGCILTIVVAARRRRAVGARLDAPGDLAPLGRGEEPARWGPTAAAALGSAVAAGFFAGWWAAVPVGLAVVVACRSRWGRVLLAGAPAVLIGLVGLYMTYKQVRDHLPSVFEWPTLTPRAVKPAWLAVLLVVAGGVVEAVRGREPPDEAASGGGGAPADPQESGRSTATS